MPNSCMCGTVGRAFCRVHPMPKKEVAPAPKVVAPPEPKPDPKPAPPPPPPPPVVEPEAPLAAEPAAKDEGEFYSQEDLWEMSKRQLLGVAAENKIVIPKKARKEEIIALLIGEG